MSEYTFPEQRFVQAGIPQSDVDQMRRSFNTSDLTIQRALVEFWQPISVGALLDYVQTQRDAGLIVASESSESEPDVDSRHFDVNDKQNDTKDFSSTSDDDPHIGD
jgi:hypothetical protein